MKDAGWRASGAEEDREAWLHAQARAGGLAAIVVDLRQTLLGHPVPAGAPHLGGQLERAIGRWSHAVVDLQGVQLLHSYVLGVLVQVRRTLVARGGDLVVASSTPAIRLVFEVLGLSEHLPLHATAAEALGAQGWRDAARGAVEFLACD